MSNTLKFGAGKWANKKGSTLAYNDENNNYKPLPFDFSRGSSATRVNKDGLIETVGSGQPRIDFKDNTKGALLLEPSRTNFITYSEDFSNSVWSTWQSTKTLSNNINPKGTNGYYEISHTGSSSNNPNTRLTNVSLNGSYTLSFFIKINQSRYISLSIEDYNGDRARVYFDTINKTFTTISNVGSPITNTSYSEFSNGWIKISLSVNLLNAVYNEVGIGIYNPSGSFPSASGEVISVFGAQLEQGSYATSYIPTSGQANGVTRLADSCSQTLPSPVFNSYPFSVFAEVDVVDTSTGYVFSLLKSTSSAEYFTIEYFSNVWHITARPNGSTERITSTTTVTKGTHKIVGVWESSSMKLYLNGSLIASGSNSQSFNIQVNSMLLGQLRISGDTGSRNTVRQTELYNNALTDEQAIALTTI